jgi:hypothetical protein
MLQQTFSIPQRVVGAGLMVTGGVRNPRAFPNPRALTANLIESGALVENYPAPSYGAVPVYLPRPVAPPLGGALGAGDLVPVLKIVGGSALAIGLATWAATRLVR